jgi:hypothetical protein
MMQRSHTACRFQLQLAYGLDVGYEVYDMVGWVAL